MTIQLPLACIASLRACAAAASLMIITSPAFGDEPCPGTEDGLAACRAYLEINATDGDIGFHAKLDAEAWKWAVIFDPRGRPTFTARAFGGLRRQALTEFSFESEEPPCWFDPDDEDVDWEPQDVVTLAQVFKRFPQGSYQFRTLEAGGGMRAGSTIMSHLLPGAPTGIELDGNVIRWQPGTDLGRCEPDDGSNAGSVPVVAYQVIFEPDVDAEEPADELAASQIFDVLVPGDVYQVTLPDDYLASLPDNTPAKMEIVAIERRDNGSFGNQVAAEEGDICVNETGEGCEAD